MNPSTSLSLLVMSDITQMVQVPQNLPCETLGLSTDTQRLQDSGDAGRAGEYGGPRMADTGPAVGLLVLLALIRCIVAEKVGKGAIALQQGCVSANLRHLPVG